MRLWWNPQRLDEPVWWDSTIVRGHDLFDEILAAPVPSPSGTAARPSSA